MVYILVLNGDPMRYTWRHNGITSWGWNMIFNRWSWDPWVSDREMSSALFQFSRIGYVFIICLPPWKEICDWNDHILTDALIHELVHSQSGIDMTALPILSPDMICQKSGENASRQAWSGCTRTVVHQSLLCQALSSLQMPPGLATYSTAMVYGIPNFTNYSHQIFFDNLYYEGVFPLVHDISFIRLLYPHSDTSFSS